MEEKVDIVALGELLIDFTEAGHSQGGRKLFEQNPGGAPENFSPRCKPLWVFHFIFNHN